VPDIDLHALHGCAAVICIVGAERERDGNASLLVGALEVGKDAWWSM